MGLILLYHRVSELASDPQRLAVTPDRFSKQMDVICSHFKPMGLGPLVEHSRRGTLPPDAIAVTFDDGYADNLENARPLLERWDVPATFFVATSYIGSGREFWWDELERLLLGQGSLPRVVRLGIGRATREWDLGGFSEYDASACAHHAAWHVERKDDPTPRHRAYRELCGLLRTCSPVMRDAALRELAAQVPDHALGRATHRVLSADDVAALSKVTNSEIGAHSLSHPSLSTLPVDEQRQEIVSSKSAVEAMTGRRTTAFAYPFGTAADYTNATVTEVSSAGFACACLATPGRVERKTDPLRLPRLIVRDWDPGAFEARLREWQ
jgi:peptidoglycan/xylan/chitin deacetylase (PgdA/CDA1 family)